MVEILTTRFSIPPSVHARLALARRSARFWMTVALPLLILIVAGFYYDTRLLFVAAAVAFLLFPTLLLIAWHNLLTRPSAVNGMYPQTVRFSRDDEITVRYYPLATANDEEIRSEHHPDELIIPSAEISDCRLHGDYLDIMYGAGNDLLIPLSALPTPESISLLLQRYGRPLE